MKYVNKIYFNFIRIKKLKCVYICMLKIDMK